MNNFELFNLSGKIAIITGGAGLMGRQHAEAIARSKGIPVLTDLPGAHPVELATSLSAQWNTEVVGYELDITQAAEIERVRDSLLERFKRIDILVNNAANNPKVETPGDVHFSRVENFSQQLWDNDIAVGLTGAFLCSKIFGGEMARQGAGVIVNIASDLSLISPDQRLYRLSHLPENQQPVKPITYSVIKTGLIGMTRYLATYWAQNGVRVNAISPGGIYNSQNEEFVERLSKLIPLGRMAHLNEYQGALLFLCSDASSYMTGSNLVIDGGRTCW
jgi:NAD(P)-dependent dehydrogenase (short-subunit alcohol dehydrogenase family)